MRDIKQAFWIAGQNFYGWKKSPRIWMTFILAAILCLMLSDQIISHAIKYETILQVFEPFIWTYGDASSVMLSSLFLYGKCVERNSGNVGLWRWGEHNRSCFHKNNGKLNSLYVRSNSVWTCTFIYSFYRSSHVVFKSGCGKYGRGDRCFCSQSVRAPAEPRCFPETVSFYRKSGI